MTHNVLKEAKLSYRLYGGKEAFAMNKYFRFRAIDLIYIAGLIFMVGVVAGYFWHFMATGGF